jgi:hypothetical protein
MSGQTSEFDFDAVDCIVLGVPVSGFGEDDAIEFVTDEDGYEEVWGVDGDVTMSKNLKVAGTLNLTLLQSSRANAALTAIYAADRLQNGGAGVGPSMILDRNGGSTIATDTSRIMKMPDVKHGKKAGPRVWKIRFFHHTHTEVGT